MQPDWEDQEDPGDKQHKNGTKQTQAHSMTIKDTYAKEPERFLILRSEV